MQAIITKYLPATNFKGSRIKAHCERGSITIDYPHELSGDAVHIAAADALIAKFIREDEKRYGTNRNPWSGPRICGQLPDGNYVHTFSGITGNPAAIKFASPEDVETFRKCLDKIKSQEGTIAPLYCGLLCSALKRATI